VLDVGADHAGGVRGGGLGIVLDRFRRGAIFPGKHFFRDDVGLFAYAAGKEFGGLENRRADFVEIVGAEDVADGGFDEVPERRFGRRRSRVPRGDLIAVAGRWSLVVRRPPGPWREAFHPGVSVGLD